MVAIGEEDAVGLSSDPLAFRHHDTPRTLCSNVLSVQQHNSRSPQLDCSIRFLFGLSGVTGQLPSLALLAIVNDRVAIPPAFLPAYSAVAFLPASLKPLYAWLSQSKTAQHQEIYVFQVLAALFAANAFAYVGTALLIPVGHIIACFIWAFLRGISSAWSSFLLDRILILQAQYHERLNRNQLSSNHAGDTEESAYSYQALSSMFQAQAATYRNIGSLLASINIFALFLWRQYDGTQKKGAEPLSETVVTILLLSTAGLHFMGCAVISLGTHGESYSRVENGEVEILSWESHTVDPTQTNTVSNRGQQQDFPTPTQTSISWSYDALSPTSDPTTNISASELSDLRTNTRAPEETLDAENWVDEDFPPSDTSGAQSLLTLCQSKSLHDYSGIALLVVFQALLVMAALRRPIVSISNKCRVLWVSTVAVLILCLFGVICIFTLYKEGPSRSDQKMKEKHALTNAKVVPAKDLCLYLVLRHSIPIASMLMYSYIYTIFENEPVFLQVLMVVEAAASVGANWFYSQYFAKYHSGYRIIALIAVLSISAALISLLDVIVVHMAARRTPSLESGDVDVDTKLRLVVFTVAIATYFMGQICYMPMLVLSTANVVSFSESEACPAINESIETSNHHSTDELNSDNFMDFGNNKKSRNDFDGELCFKDEGMQYATFVACIDFGAQIGDWISVPIIAAFGVTRENNWANLDRYIIFCAVARIASVTFLWLIRPK